ncbi:MAG: class I SAM-dependent methyltransferase [Terrimicrobiaceae bacterium]
MKKSERPNAVANTEDFEFAALNEARCYRTAIVEEFSPFVSGQVIEVGAGIGQLTALFAEKIGRENIQGIEPDRKFAELFRQNLPNVRFVEGTVDDLPPDAACNTVISINVMEHIHDHVGEMSKYHQLLHTQKGNLCILTPARPEIYAPIDEDFGHFRRYTKKSLRDALILAGFTPRKIFYFNFPGYFLWFLNFKLLRSRSFNPAVVRLYDRTVFRLTHLAERGLVRPPIGQSLIAIAQA